jgi:CRISPR-associated protein Csx10
MNRIDLTITALSPLAIGRQKPGSSISEVESYIPGMVIRGAIASQILQQSGQQSTDLAENGGHFQSLFLGDTPAIFQNAYPAIATVGKEEDSNNQGIQISAQCVEEQVLVIPATAVSSKNDPGFKWEQDKNKPKEEQKGGVFDTLIDRFCAEAYNQPYDPSCPKDYGRIEPLSGFYSKTNDTEVKYPYRSHAISTRFLTRVGINRRRATAEEEILYSIEVLNESFLQQKRPLIKWQPTVYRSSILVTDSDLADSLKQYINGNGDHFRVGGSVSRGLGKVAIKAADKKNPKDIETRINSFNDALQKRWGLWAIFGAINSNSFNNRTFFSLDLQSDAILTENWQHTTVISEVMLQQIVGITDITLKLEVAYSSYEYRSGWNSAWGLMKDVELVTNKGAVYFFSIETNRKSEWLEVLEILELQGMGERTCEGFGQVRVCDEFHLVFREGAQ